MADHNVRAAARILGVSPATAYRLVASGDLESYDVAPANSRRPKTRVSDEHIARFRKARARKPKRLRSA